MSDKTFATIVLVGTLALGFVCGYVVGAIITYKRGFIAGEIVGNRKNQTFWQDVLNIECKYKFQVYEMKKDKFEEFKQWLYNNQHVYPSKCISSDHHTICTVGERPESYPYKMRKDF